MHVLGQTLLSSLGFGGIYALAALGLVLIFKTSGVVNFAFGAMATVVTFIMWTMLNQAGLPVWASWLVAVAAALCVGATSDVLLLEWVRRTSLMIQIVLTVGLLIFIEGIVGAIWGYSPKAIPTPFSRNPVGFAGYFIERNDIFIVVLTVLVALAMGYVFQRTRFGLAMRAVAHNRAAAALMGVPVRWYVTAAWAIGVAITGLSAILAAPQVSLDPLMMDDIAVFAFAAAVLGGFGSLVGAVAGGFVVGIVSNLIAVYLSTNLQLTLVFCVIILVLYVRPRGLFGARAGSAGT